MDISKKDNLTDLAETLPKTPAPSSQAKPGTVISTDGTRVTLGAGGVTKPAVSPPQRGTNLFRGKK